MPSPWASVLCLDPRSQGWGGSIAQHAGHPRGRWCISSRALSHPESGAQVTTLARSPGRLDTHVAEGQDLAYSFFLN